MKIYTKTGDRGTTGLFGGERVSKSSARIESYGEIDELNSQIGVCVALAQSEPKLAGIAEALVRIQHQLFAMGSSLATPTEEVRKHLPALNPEWVSALEQWIDAMEAQLSELGSFIVPGGSRVAAQIHVARTVCRRAERAVVKCAEQEAIELIIQQYLNRLSDALFVCSRYVNMLSGVSDIPWQKE